MGCPNGSCRRYAAPCFLLRYKATQRLMSPGVTLNIVRALVGLLRFGATCQNGDQLLAKAVIERGIGPAPKTGGSGSSRHCKTCKTTIGLFAARGRTFGDGASVRLGVDHVCDY